MTGDAGTAEPIRARAIFNIAEDCHPSTAIRFLERLGFTWKHGRRPGVCRFRQTKGDITYDVHLTVDPDTCMVTAVSFDTDVFARFAAEDADARERGDEPANLIPLDGWLVHWTSAQADDTSPNEIEANRATYTRCMQGNA